MLSEDAKIRQILGTTNTFHASRTFQIRIIFSIVLKKGYTQQLLTVNNSDALVIKL